MVRQKARRLFTRLTPSTERTFADIMRNERAGGVLMLVGTVSALVWINSAWSDGYTSLRDYVPIDRAVTLFGGVSFHVDLSLAQWATDGLLAIFFFVIGLELKRELVVGELRRPSTAVVPIVAAIGGMAVPALIYLAVNLWQSDGVTEGWAVPTATDIAFALAVVAVVGRRLPNSMRAFLLTLAVVDDLLAIVIIAIFFSHGFTWGWLLASGVALLVFALLVQRRVTSPWLLVPLAVATWAFMHESGIHATIAGVALGLVVPAMRRDGESQSVVEHWEHRWAPFSAGVAVPIFAFFAAGVAMNWEALSAVISDPASQGIALGLVVGKPIGIIVATALVANLTRASLDRGLSWWDVTGIATVAGIGFTVSLLIGELAFGDSGQGEYVKASVLLASAVAAIAGASILGWRDRHYGRVYAQRATPVPEDEPES